MGGVECRQECHCKCSEEIDTNTEEKHVRGSEMSIQDEVRISIVRRRTTRQRRPSARDEHPVSPAAADGPVALVLEQVFKNLSVPWPRQQDLPPDASKLPKPQDFVVAISHGWPYQVHPDPMGLKAPIVLSLVKDAIEVVKPVANTFVFLDFCSVPQRPFREDQPDRTKEEAEVFSRCLKCMPDVYLMADAILHVEMEYSDLNGDGEIVELDALDLEGSDLIQLGSQIQIIARGKSEVRLFDFLISIDGCDVEGNVTAEDANKIRLEATSAARPCPIRIQRAPMGRRNDTPERHRGWLYLERFVTMVKAAMLEETEFDRICFSNSPTLLEELKAGAKRLRDSAQAGGTRLWEELAKFTKELNRKQFAPSSTDGDTVKRTFSQRRVSASMDSEVIAGLMESMVMDLPAHWASKAREQKQRQLVLAVNRHDHWCVLDCLADGADPNVEGERGMSCLHLSAKYQDIQTTRVLLEHKADPSQQDRHGNCPAHVLPFVLKEDCVQHFDLLAPTKDVLDLSNVAGVRPARRFAAWAATAQGNQPYAHAQEIVERLNASCPEVFKKRGEAQTHAFRRLSLVQSAVRRDVCKIDVSGREVCAFTWEATEAADDQDHLLFINMPPCVPWSMIDSPMDELLGKMCMCHNLKIFLVNCRSCSYFNTLDLPVADLHEFMLGVIAGLPLNFRFTLVENSAGQMTALLWRLRPRLDGWGSFNITSFHENEYWSSPAWKGMQGILSKMSKMFEDGCTEDIKTKMFGVGVYYDDAESFASTKAEFDNAVDEAPPENWAYAASFMRPKRKVDLHELFRTASPMTFCPMILVLGDNAPVPFQEATQMLRDVLLPNADVLYIEDSKVWWFVEGVRQVANVKAHLDALLRKVDDWRKSGRCS